jgi:dTDP-4-amino-4,6-dideoxygalactose transaminase
MTFLADGAGKAQPNSVGSALEQSVAYRIPFNRPFIAGKELFYIANAVTDGQIAADGIYTKRCSRFLEERFATNRALMTPSCTAALEMAAILCDLGPEDEVILPSYTFVSTASAVVRTGARPVFVDIRPDTLNLDETKIEEAVTPHTKAIVPVHYAGVGCEMDAILAIAEKYGLRVIEDAAQGVHAYYKGRALGSIGHLGAYSFHETKNYICGEGGALCVNDPTLVRRAEIIRDKGTNRQQFFRGEVDKYTWVDIGSSYVPSEISAAFLWAQFENLDVIAQRRQDVFERYHNALTPLETMGLLRVPRVPTECQTNCHMFYILLPTMEVRDQLMACLRTQGIQSVFHYVPLHSSPIGKKIGTAASELPVTTDLSGRLLRLPFYYELTPDEQSDVVGHISHFLTHEA